MANVLKMVDQSAIVGLWHRGWSARRIARETGIHRETVGRYIRLARAPSSVDNGLKPAISTAGYVGQNQPNLPVGSAPFIAETYDADTDSNPAIALTGSAHSNPAISTLGSVGRQSLCETFRDAIRGMLELGLSAQRIWQDLRDDYGFTGGYQSVKRYVRRLRAATPLPSRRMECDPGQQAQVDFGTGAPITTADGRRRRTHVFCIVLSYSRKAYREAVYRQTTDEFIRCLENAFHHFGGVPATLVIDNLKAAVTRADWYDPDLNPKIQSFAQHYGTVIMPTKPRTPRHKGKVERGVGYVQDNALKGKQFASLAEQNAYLLQWEARTADTRIHGTTCKQVRQSFEVERPKLLLLPVDRFSLFQEGRRKVNRDGHIEVDKAYYSVPPEYLGRHVWARWDTHVVRLFNDRFEQIAIHLRCERGKFSTQDGHIHAHKRGSIERGAAWLLNKASLIGTQTGRWAEQMIQQRGIEGVRVLQGLLSLANRHSGCSIEQACETALTHGAYRLRTIRELIKRKAPTQEQFEFIKEHPMIRSLGEYGQLVRNAIASPGGTSSAGSPTPLPWASSPPLPAGESPGRPVSTEASTSIGGHLRE